MAQPVVFSQRNLYGEIGYLDMPSAHMAQDGELSFTVGDIGKSQRYSFAFQALPWFEGSFRYSHVVGRYGGYDYDHYYDRSFGLKIRLVEQGEYMPDISIGSRDVLGTGIYSAEYLALSKKIGAVDLTGGLGWGRLSERSISDNPFGVIWDRMKNRPNDNRWGTFNEQLFRGKKLGAFGGLSWQTPIRGLDVLAEYSSDKYSLDGRFAGGVRQRSPVNVGLSYRPFESIAISGGWMYGTTYGFTVSFRGNAFEDASSALRIGPSVPAAVVRSTDQQKEALRVVSADASGTFEAKQKAQSVERAIYRSDKSVRSVTISSTRLSIVIDSAGSLRAACARFAHIAFAHALAVDTVVVNNLSDAPAVACAIDQGDKDSAVRTDSSASAVIQPSVQSWLPLDAPSAAGTSDFEAKLRAKMADQALVLYAVDLKHSDVTVYFGNGRYRKTSEAAGRIVRLLMASAPPSVEFFHLVPVSYGIPMQEITVARSMIERTIVAEGAPDEIYGAVAVAGAAMDTPLLDQAIDKTYPTFRWSIDPKMTEHIFDPDKPLQFLFYANASGEVELAQGWSVSSAWTFNLWNDYQYDRPAGSNLPHVRTDLLKYVHDGKYGMASLQTDYRFRLTPEVFASAKAGYLEDMYAGAGGQVLWRPNGSRLSFGADLYQVWKRDFDRLFGLQKFNVLTGHVSVYYESPWYGLVFKAHAGRFLARDYGASVEVTRRFSSGVEVGAFSTFTNVPFHKFGEGSFDKGLIIRIPLQWALPIFSQSSYDLHMSSLTRDGGQRLEGDDSLYDETQRTSHGEISENFGDFLSP